MEIAKNTYDLIIIGGGPAGLTAGLYASRAKLNTLLIEKMGPGGHTAIIDWIENYPGFPQGISGFDLANKIEEQTKKFGLKIVFEKATSLCSSSGTEKIVSTTENEYKAFSVIIATGAKYQTLDIFGEKEFLGKGVSYCATCDGPFFKDKNITVVGGGNSAVQEAIYLTKFAKSVSIIHRRDRLRATKLLQDRALNNPKINLIWNSIVTSIQGNEKVENISVKNVKNNKEQIIPMEGVFIFIGLKPNNDIFINCIETDDKGYVLTDNEMKTSFKGIFACGDVRKKTLRQIVTAVGDGATAAFSAQEYIDEIKGTAYK